MKLPAQTEAKLRILATQGRMPASQCGSSFRNFLSPLLHTGVVEFKRKGAGCHLVVNDAHALDKFYSANFPNHETPAGTRTRIEGLARFRDTKAIASDSAEIISLRVWQEDALTKDGEPVGAALATRSHGVFSFLLNKPTTYQISGVFALVENPVVFEAVETITTNICAAIYAHGRISRRILNWLANNNGSNFHILHFPDYDPVGLSEFQRLRLHLGDRVSLYVPSDLEARFAKYSKRELLEKRNNQTMLATLRKSGLPEIRCLVELIDRHNAGLEQEALLV